MIESRETETGLILLALPRSIRMSVSTWLWNIGGTAMMTTSFLTAIGKTASSRAVLLEMSFSTEGSIVSKFRSIIDARWNVNCRRVISLGFSNRKVKKKRASVKSFLRISQNDGSLSQWILFSEKNRLFFALESLGGSASMRKSGGGFCI